MRRNNRNPWLLLLLITIGLVSGGIIGEIFKEKISILTYSKGVGFAPFTIDFIVLKLTVGLMLSINMASIIGILLAIFIFYRL